MNLSRWETQEQKRKRKGRKKTFKNKPKTIKKMEIGTYISIITLNVNGLNAPTKRNWLAEWIQKQDLNVWFIPGGSDGKESACNAGDLGLIPGLGRSPGEGNGHPLQSSCLENSMDRGAGKTQSMGPQGLDTTEQLSLLSLFLLLA